MVNWKGWERTALVTEAAKGVKSSEGDPNHRFENLLKEEIMVRFKSLVLWDSAKKKTKVDSTVIK